MISSKDNAKIKELVKLRQAKYRNSSKMFLVEGPHLVKEAREKGYLVEAFSLEEKEGYTAVSEEVMKKIAQTDTIVSEVGLCKMKEEGKLTDKILILDAIQDPGNLGTILRSAKAFGFNTVVLGKGSCDVYNDKVIRSSQGAIFKLNILNKDLLSFIPSLKDYAVYGTNVRNGISVDEVKPACKMAIILGNEGNGISKEVDALVSKNIYLKLDDMESLNVAIAGAIIMYEIKKKEA